MRVVLATGNSGKIAEMNAILGELGWIVVPQTTLGVTPADETGSTFEANAVLKARHAARATGLPALADDSGLEVDVLAGAPGVRSARYAGEHASDGECERCQHNKEPVGDGPADNLGDHRLRSCMMRRRVGPSDGWSKPNRTRSPFL